MIVEYFLEWVETAPVARRIEATRALIRAWMQSKLTDAERDDAEAAITVLLDDPAPGVRMAIAEGFAAWRMAPRHIISALASDNSDIASLVLSCSPVFHDAELEQLIETGTTEQQIAIACRPWLSTGLVNTICNHGCEDACLGLLMNPAAKFAAADFVAMAGRHGAVTDVRVVLLERPDLAPEARLILIDKLGESLGALVDARNWMPKKKTGTVIRDACDRASIFYTTKTTAEEMGRVIQSLIEQERLNAAYLLRALCTGNIALFARALSELSSISLSRIETMMTRDRRAAFRAVYDRAGLPAAGFGVFYCAISTWRELLTSDSPINQSRLPFIVTREVLRNYTDGQDKVVDELLVILRRLGAETARDSARAKAKEIIERPKGVLMLDAPAANPENLPQPDTTELELDEDYVAEFAANLELELQDVEIDAVDPVEIDTLVPDYLELELSAGLGGTDFPLDMEFTGSEAILHPSVAKAA